MKQKKLIRKKRGILLEYVLLLCSILPLVFASSMAVYKLGYGYSGGFGTYGKSIVGWYQRIITIISLPIP